MAINHKSSLCCMVPLFVLPTSPHPGLPTILPMLGHYKHSAPPHNFSYRQAYLDEPNILAFLPEALSAEIQTIFSDETGPVFANSTVEVP